MVQNKKGFMTIYLCLFLLTLISICMLFTGGVRQGVLQSSGKTLSRLWAQSILAEYDLNLQQRYHIFGFYGYPAQIKEKLDFYMKKSFGVEENIAWEITSCNLYDYTLRNVDIFKHQMIAAGKQTLTEGSSKQIQPIIPVAGHAPAEGDELFAQLPSEGSKNRLSISAVTDLLKQHSSIGSVLKDGSNQYFETEYIFSHFKDKQNHRNIGASYFDAEIEYIVGGKQSDTANEKYVRNIIIAIREVLNLIYLNKTEKTRNEALAAAELLTPGPAAAATQQTLLGLWALAESVNDYRLLSAGHRVSLMKTESTWAMDLSSAMKNEEDGFIFTGVEDGDNYDDYLRLLIYMTDERVRILRVMDLIQINFRWLYYNRFLLCEYNGGLCFTYMLDGKEHQVELYYEKE